jgi:hypothetical protein
MQYFMTKEIGAAWSESSGIFDNRWGVAQGQLRLAKRVEPGDVLLHFVDSVRSWVGYSTAAGPVQENNLDREVDWRAALPFVIPIQKEVWLDEGQAQHSNQIPALSHCHFHRVVAFRIVSPADGEVVVAGIKNAANREPGEIDDEFHQRWLKHAESFYKEIVIRLANGRCQLCGDDARTWADAVRFPLTESEVEKFRTSFLDVAHIKPNCQQGSMLADNLRALCPTCHRVADRLSDKRRYQLFERIKLQSDWPITENRIAGK